MIEKPLVPKEGWYVLHLFYRVEHGQWELLSPEGKIRAKTDLSEIVQEARSLPETQLLTFSVVSPKADLAFMLLTNDLITANLLEKKLGLSLGEEILTPVFSFLSMTERSEYTTSEDEYSASVVAEKNFLVGSTEHTAAMEDFSKRMAKYAQDRLYPNMPDWPIFCFYPMNKRRDAVNNWYALDFATRKKLMAGHAAVGRTYAGRVRQLITGSTGLDDAEWGVTLFAHDLSEIKSIVYEMRFDEVSAKYADFGDFFIGLQMPLNELFHQARI
jgi:hydrogen peroxide-dependent heme synthase